jgi:hypothetical protein
MVFLLLQVRVKLELIDGSKAWPQRIHVRLCEKNYGVHMVLDNEEKIFKALGKLSLRKLVFAFCPLGQWTNHSTLEMITFGLTKWTSKFSIKTF